MITNASGGGGHANPSGGGDWQELGSPRTGKKTKIRQSASSRSIDYYLIPGLWRQTKIVNAGRRELWRKEDRSRQNLTYKGGDRTRKIQYMRLKYMQL